MTASKYLILRFLLAAGLPLSTRNLMKQSSQEGRFLNQLYFRLGARRWQCAEGVADLKTQYTLVDRLVESRNSINERIQSLRDQLTAFDTAEPAQSEASADVPPDKPDALIREIRYRQDSIHTKSKEMEQIRRVLGESDLLYLEYVREMEILRQHLHHLKKKLASFQQKETATQPVSSHDSADIFRQKLTIALQSLKLHDQQLETLMEPYYVKIGQYLVRNPHLLRTEGKWQGKDGRLLALIRAVERSHNRLCRLSRR